MVVAVPVYFLAIFLRESWIGEEVTNTEKLLTSMAIWPSQHVMVILTGLCRTGRGRHKLAIITGSSHFSDAESPRECQIHTPSIMTVIETASVQRMAMG